jgi:hypothetical protein
MPTVPNARGTEAKTRVYIGVIFDEYTPQVESQILRDCMAMQHISDRNEEIVLVTDSDKPDKVLEAIGMRSVPTGRLAKTWIIYKTKEQWPKAPDWATTEIQRDLYMPKKDLRLLQVDEAESNGYYLPPQGRLSPDTLSLERPAPNGYIPCDPAMLVVWNPNFG